MAKHRSSELHTFRNLVLLTVLVCIFLSVTGLCGSCHCNINVTDNRGAAPPAGSQGLEAVEYHDAPDASVSRHPAARTAATRRARQ